MEQDYICDKPERITLDKHGFENYQVWRYRALGDGNCFFHSVLMGFIKPYRRRVDEEGKVVHRQRYAECLRDQLATKLGEKTGLSLGSPILYDVLSRGKLREFSKTIPDYTLENIQKLLRSNDHVGLEVIELTAIVLNINIFLIDIDTKDVYKTGDSELLFSPDRKGSVVLLYSNNHFDLCGITKYGRNDSEDKIISHFKNDNPFIKLLLERSGL